MAVLVSAKSLSFSWKEGQALLSNLNFEVERGEFISLVGPNGSGKTTLVRLLLGLLKPNSGELRWHEKVKIGYVPQFSHLDEHFPITAWEVVLMGQTSRVGFSSLNLSKRRKAEKALRQVELWNKKAQPFSRLSGGQKQRVLIARALCSEPDVLILDEPTASLDIESTETIYGILQEFSSERKTIFAISHDLNFVSSMTSRVFCLENPFVVHSTLHYIESYHPDRLARGDGQRALVCHGHCDACS